MNSESNQTPELKRAETNEAPTADDDRLEKAPARLDELLERGEISPEAYAEYSATADAPLAPSVDSSRHTHNTASRSISSTSRWADTSPTRSLSIDPNSCAV